MRTKQFKAESKRLLEMMINSIYTHKEIFLRELISNASDAMDKLYFKSMSENIGITRSDMAIRIEADKDDRKLILTDKGKEIANHVQKKAIEAVGEAGAGISDEDRRVFYECLGTIASNLKKISAEGLSDDER